MAKKNSAFSNAQAAVMKAFHDLERAMGMMPAAPQKAKKAKQKAAKKTKAKKTKKSRS